MRSLNCDQDNERKTFLLLYVPNMLKYTDGFCSLGLLLNISEMLQCQITFKEKGNVFEEPCQNGFIACREPLKGLHGCTC